MATFTRYCLSGAMLKRLSAVVNGNMPKGVRGGQSALALVRRQLIAANPKASIDAPGEPWYLPTDTGKWALEQARKEGW